MILTGYQPAEEEQRQLAAVRDRFNHTTRFGEDDEPADSGKGSIT